jgi:hypothetical protein
VSFISKQCRESGILPMRRRHKWKPATWILPNVIDGNIDADNFPQWNLKIQVMTEEMLIVRTIIWDPFDITKVWPHADYPL